MSLVQLIRANKHFGQFVPNRDINYTEFILSHVQHDSDLTDPGFMTDMAMFMAHANSKNYGFNMAKLKSLHDVQNFLDGVRRVIWENFGVDFDNSWKDAISFTPSILDLKSFEGQDNFVIEYQNKGRPISPNLGIDDYVDRIGNFRKLSKERLAARNIRVTWNNGNPVNHKLWLPVMNKVANYINNPGEAIMVEEHILNFFVDNKTALSNIQKDEKKGVKIDVDRILQILKSSGTDANHSRPTAYAPFARFY